MNGMEEEIVLLVEDNPNDELLTVRPKEERRKEPGGRRPRRGRGARLPLRGGLLRRAETTAIPQIILLDLRLPKKDGLEVLRRLWADERTRPTPVVFTSSKEKRDLIDNSGLQANGYVRKPVELEEFVEAVRQLER